MAGAYPASVFIIIPINDVVAAVFYAPVTAVDLEDVVGVSLIRCVTGDAVSGFGCGFPSFFIEPFALDHEGLADVGKVEIGIELGSDPDLPCLNSAMVEVNGDRVRFLAVLEIQGEIFEESGLIAFDGEMVMGLPVFDEVASQEALRQQGVGADGLTLDADRLEQGNGHFDFVGLLDLIAAGAYRQGADFFWVWQVLLSWPITLMI